MQALPKFLTSEETATLLRLPVTAVWRLCRQNKLPTVPGVRPYRIIRTELMKGGRTVNDLQVEKKLSG